MSDQETDLEKLERDFPGMADAAFNAARERALATGQSVLQSEGEFIYEVFPNGDKKQVKQIEPRISVKPGTKIRR